MTAKIPSAAIAPPDYGDRAAALRGIEESLLLEAGAGSGKTSVLAGRIAVLFASGVEPKHVAAITFTEFAASGLLERIHRFVQALAEGHVPRDLALAFPQGVSVAQRARLEAARAKLDQLTCSTIHGFAQALIKPYPVEADIDPGANIVDPGEAELAFQEHLEAWLKERLSGEFPDDIIAELVLADEGQGLKLVQTVANFCKSNRDVCAPDGDWRNDLISDLQQAIQAYGAALRGLGFGEADTAKTLEAFAEVGEAARLSGVASGMSSNAGLLRLLALPRPEACFTQKGSPRKLQTKGKWEAAAKAAGRSKSDGTRAWGVADQAYQRCHEALAALATAAASEALIRLVASLDDLMRRWRDYKRAAALLDFDDLLYTARDLLAGRDEVRRALAGRFRHVLVDEFQDTDPLQIEILWRLCGEAAPGHDKPSADSLTRQLRPGALFLVGDPKQAIYRFRGADVNAYLAARTSVGAEGLRQITANFRSAAPILEFVNEHFAQPLAVANGQPGFTALDPIVKPSAKEAHVAALNVQVEGDKPGAEQLRDAEASRVADLCRRLIGNRIVRDPETGEPRPCAPGDIALLAPVGTDLWRFEAALEDLDIPVSTQAGKGFFIRQEVQDLIALTRTLADARDTLALGAVLRGPLVGLTEGELLDIADQLPPDPEYPERLRFLNLWTPIEEVKHELAHFVLGRLQVLARRVRSTTPYLLLAAAVEDLDVRAQLRQRFRTGAERALANVDLYLQMARAYDVRGLRAFARDMRANWEEATRQIEGRPDAEQQAVALITVHAAKGLEWPIVIPVNTTGSRRANSGIVYNRGAGRFLVPILGVEPRGYTDLKTWNDEEQARERVRLWYVAATRARDLLVLPRHSARLPENSWAKAIELDLAALPALEPDECPEGVPPVVTARENLQTQEIFAKETQRLAQSERKLTWRRPSRDEATTDNPGAGEHPWIATSVDAVDETVANPVLAVAGSATRGTILHKLMEEVLTGETADDVSALTTRARELMAQLQVEPATDPRSGIAPAELAETVVRTLRLPEISALRPRLLPETTVFGCERGGNGEEVLVSGVADAVAVNVDGTIDVVIDWKSDVAADAAKLAAYRRQVETYRKAMGATSALLVLMTAGTVIAVTGV